MKNGEDTTKPNSPVIQTPSLPSTQIPAIQPSDNEAEVAEELLGRAKRARPPPGYYKALMKGDKPSGGGMTAFTEKEHDYQLSAVNLDDEDLLFAGIAEEYALAAGTGGEPRTLKHEILEGTASDLPPGGPY